MTHWKMLAFGNPEWQPSLSASCKNCTEGCVTMPMGGLPCSQWQTWGCRTAGRCWRLLHLLKQRTVTVTVKLQNNYKNACFTDEATVITLWFNLCMKYKNALCSINFQHCENLSAITCCIANNINCISITFSFRQVIQPPWQDSISTARRLLPGSDKAGVNRFSSASAVRLAAEKHISGLKRLGCCRMAGNTPSTVTTFVLHEDSIKNVSEMTLLVIRYADITLVHQITFREQHVFFQHTASCRQTAWYGQLLKWHAALFQPLTYCVAADLFQKHQQLA